MTNIHSNSIHSLEFTPDERNDYRQAIDRYIDDFLTRLPIEKTFYGDMFNKTPEDEKFAIDEAQHPLDELLTLFQNRLDKPGLNAASGGHLGYIPGGGLYIAALADYIVAATNRYPGVFYACPGAVRIENALIDWAGQLVGYEKGFGGNHTTGGSTANLIALTTAKRVKNIKGADLATSVIYTSRQSHHSILKALRMVGLDECVLREIPYDENYRMEIQTLTNQLTNDKAQGLNPFLVIANAGSTDVGAVDDLDAIAQLCQKENLWFHVDAAYGGFFLLTEYGKQKLKGIERADSVILDPHKSLFLPYGSGMVLVKKAQDLINTFSYAANYMQDTEAWQEEMSPADLSPELSRSFRGLRMWLALKIHGVKAFEECLNEKIALTHYFCKAIQKLGFELGNQPDLTVGIFRMNVAGRDRNELNKAILNELHQDGRIFISSTHLKDEFWLRVAILSFRTHQREVDILLEMIQLALKKCLV